MLDANPLDDIKNTAKIAEVMKNGRLYDAATLDETYPRKKPLDQQWWWKLEPPTPPTKKGSAGVRSQRLLPFDRLEHSARLLEGQSGNDAVVDREDELY